MLPGPPALATLLTLIILAPRTVTAGTDTMDSVPVTIETTIQGRMIEWHVTNSDRSSIVEAHFPAYTIYNRKAPAGWDVNEGQNDLTAKLGEGASPLRAGGKGTFSVRGVSSGSILVEGAARFIFDDGRSIEIPGVRTFGPERRSTVILVPLVLVLILALHLYSARRRAARA